MRPRVSAGVLFFAIHTDTISIHCKAAYICEEQFMQEDGKQKEVKAISAEPWEIEGVHQEFPTHTEKELEQAIVTCKSRKPKAKNRRELAECVSKKIT